MGVAKFIGPFPAEVRLPSGGTLSAVPNTNYTLVNSDIEALLASEPTWWSNEEGLEPSVPSPSPAITPVAGLATENWKASILYPPEVIVQEGGMLYLSTKASLNENPLAHPASWTTIGPVAPSGAPGMLMPIMSLGSPRGRENTYLFAEKGFLARAIIPKTGKLKDLVVLNASAGKCELRAAIYDCGQAAAKTLTRLGQGVTKTQGEAGKFQSLGSLGEPVLTAGQHVMLGVGIKMLAGPNELYPTYAGPGEGLPSEYFPGRIAGFVNAVTSAVLSGLAWPATLDTEDGTIVHTEFAPHVIARIS